MKSLQDKVAIVTGASSGIGKSIAFAYVREGAKVVVSDINEEGGNQVVEQLKKEGGEAVFVKADTGSPESCEALVKSTLQHFGKLDIACNNAGISGASAPVGEYPVESWDKVINVNLSGVFYGMRYQVPAMLQSGGGSIINMASILGQVGFANAAAYVAAKHGVVGLTKNAAMEYAQQHIRVNAVGPAFIKTPLLDQNLDAETLDQLATMHPIGRLGTPEEVAELVLWLSSDKASFVTGAYYPIDGGYLSR